MDGGILILVAGGDKIEIPVGIQIEEFRCEIIRIADVGREDRIIMGEHSASVVEEEFVVICICEEQIHILVVVYVDGADRMKEADRRDVGTGEVSVVL